MSDTPSDTPGEPLTGPVGAAGGPDSPAGTPVGPAGESATPRSGPELARAVLEAAQARRSTGARRRGGPGLGGATGATGAENPTGHRRGWSAPGPDRRDPQPFGAVLAKLVKDRGWQRPTAEATVFGRWEQVVGADVAEHCRPVKLEGGELTVEAVSTAWATQLRLLARSLVKRIAAEVGHGVVTRLHIHGPAAPSWRRGPRRVRGRGPRDTYG